MGHRNKSNREFGNKDLVTVQRSIENNDMHRRSAMKDGCRMMNTQEEHMPGTMDQIASRAGVPEFDYSKHKQWEKSFEGSSNMELGQYFNDNYTIHPALPRKAMPFRVFVYDAEIDSLQLNVPATLWYSRMSPHEADFAELEQILEAEAELGENPKVLRDAFEEVRVSIAPKTYIWQTRVN